VSLKERRIKRKYKVIFLEKPRIY